MIIDQRKVFFLSFKQINKSSIGLEKRQGRGFEKGKPRAVELVSPFEFGSTAGRAATLEA